MTYLEMLILHTTLLLVQPGLTLAVLIQSNVVKIFHHGDDVTLSCAIQTADNYLYWFKQMVGQPPQSILYFYAHSPDPVFFKEFQNDLRFAVQKNLTSMALRISSAKATDAGYYYCCTRDYDSIVFGNGVLLIYKDSNSRTVVQQVVSDPVRPGDSVTLQCTVDRETCAGEHSVYWFRHGSGESLPGLIYTHGNRRDECEKSPEAGSHTHSCVYSLPNRNLSHSDAGIYYCAVLTCGDILFGNGTVVKFPGKYSNRVQNVFNHNKSKMLFLYHIAGSDQENHIDPLVLVLAASNILCVLIIAVLCLKKTSTSGLCLTVISQETL
uniref:Ig-like domain-containing protein n=1 Tax=Scleropages formosus TaxID=113540 RepID=A0A8C9S714_SCLFO